MQYFVNVQYTWCFSFNIFTWIYFCKRLSLIKFWYKNRGLFCYCWVMYYFPFSRRDIKQGRLWGWRTVYTTLALQQTSIWSTFHGDYLERGTFLTAHLRNGRHISGQCTPPLYPTLRVGYCWMNTVTSHPNVRSPAQENPRHIVVIARHIPRLHFDGTKTALIKNYFYINSNVFTLDNVYRAALLKLSRWQVKCIITDLCIKNKGKGLINKTNYENINVDL